MREHCRKTKSCEHIKKAVDDCELYLLISTTNYCQEFKGVTIAEECHKGYSHATPIIMTLDGLQAGLVLCVKDGATGLPWPVR
jgi:hypothetical protein